MKNYAKVINILETYKQKTENFFPVPLHTEH